MQDFGTKSETSRPTARPHACALGISTRLPITPLSAPGTEITQNGYIFDHLVLVVPIQPTFNLTPPTNPAHYELIRGTFCPVFSNVIFFRDTGKKSAP